MLFVLSTYCYFRSFITFQQLNKALFLLGKKNIQYDPGTGLWCRSNYTSSLIAASFCGVFENWNLGIREADSNNLGGQYKALSFSLFFQLIIIINKIKVQIFGRWFSPQLSFALSCQRSYFFALSFLLLF